MTLQSINPATGEVLSERQTARADEVEAALDKAQAAFVRWRDIIMDDRGDLLLRLAARLRHRRDELALAATRHMGKPISQSRAEVEKCAVLCEHYAEHGERYLRAEPVDLGERARGLVRYEPLGPLLSITPWNFPYWQVLRFAVPQLMAGNPIVLKHAANVAACGDLCADLLAEAGAPEGLFQHVLMDHGQAARAIADDRIAGAAVTGSERAGMAVGRAAGEAIKPCLLELGGSDPFIVLADADMGKAAQAAAEGRFANAGQVCIAAKRIIVEAPAYDAFAQAFAAATRALPFGDPEQDDTFIGPMARVDLRDELADQLDRTLQAGADLVLEGGAVEGAGAFFKPVVLGHVAPDAAALREETFGPLAPLISARDPEQAIEIANDTRFGLSASLWSRDLARAERLAAQIEAGCVFVNKGSSSDPRLPFGGIKKSGVGRELGRHGALEFVNVKAVWLGEA